MTNEKTTIAISLKTRARLDALRAHPRDTWDDILNALCASVEAKAL